VNVHHGDEAEKTKNGEMRPLPGAPNVEVVYDTSTGAATVVEPLWFFCWRGSDRTRCWLSGNTVDTKIYVVWATGA
jgi:hypothetical protein